MAANNGRSQRAAGLRLRGIFEQYFVDGMAADDGARSLLELGSAAHVIGVAVRNDDAAHVVQRPAVAGDGVQHGVDVVGHAGIDQGQAALPLPDVAVDDVADFVYFPQDQE